jgi:hypothetical protein
MFTWEICSGFSPNYLEVGVSPRLQDESECQISLAHGLPCAGSLGVYLGV